MDAHSHSSSPDTPRSAEYVIPIAAPPDLVWKALTDPTELARWFPLTARVTPGVGGTMQLFWGDLGMDDLAIRIWKPGEHLQVGMPQPSGAARVIHDFTIEDHGASTVLRLVAHGFDPDARWMNSLTASDGVGDMSSRAFAIIWNIIVAKIALSPGFAHRFLGAPRTRGRRCSLPACGATTAILSRHLTARS
jgi:uncharacterized protein YndB with AHSA1/START domain